MNTEIVAAVVGRLRALPGVVAVPDEPSANLPNDRSIFVYAQPGQATPAAHSGRPLRPGVDAGAVFECRDSIVVEWRLKAAKDQIAAGLRAMTPAHDDVLMSLLAFAGPKNRFGGTISILHSITTADFGELPWNDGTEFAFGFRLLLDVSHFETVIPDQG